MERNPEHLIYTYTGRKFWPLDPRPEEVDIADIAHALSNMARFTGHTRDFYSVAQHSVLVSEVVTDTDALWGLLHDASEAYLADIARPVKQQMPFYKEAEERLMRVIAEHFGLTYPEPAAVKLADTLLLMTEKRDLFPAAGTFSKVHGGGIEPLTLRIDPLPPREAKDLFVQRFRYLTTPVAFRPCYLPVSRCDPELGCGLSDRDLLIRSEADRLANEPPARNYSTSADPCGR